MKRGRNDHLTPSDEARLHHLIRERKLSITELARMFNMAPRTVSIHKAEVKREMCEVASA